MAAEAVGIIVTAKENVEGSRHPAWCTRRKRRYAASPTPPSTEGEPARDESRGRVDADAAQ